MDEPLTNMQRIARYLYVWHLGLTVADWEADGCPAAVWVDGKWQIPKGVRT